MQTPSELTERVLRRFLRGGTWPGLAREIAWHAIVECDAEDEWVEWLTDLVAEQLAPRLEGLEFDVAHACAAAGGEHLRAWPHDVGGCETAAALGGSDHAAEALAAVYLETLEWAREVVRQRSVLEPSKRRPTARRTRMPPLVLQLAGGRERYGWPRRRG